MQIDSALLQYNNRPLGSPRAPPSDRVAGARIADASHSRQEIQALRAMPGIRIDLRQNDAEGNAQQRRQDRIPCSPGAGPRTSTRTCSTTSIPSPWPRPPASASPISSTSSWRGPEGLAPLLDHAVEGLDVADDLLDGGGDRRRDLAGGRCRLRGQAPYCLSQTDHP